MAGNGAGKLGTESLVIGNRFRKSNRDQTHERAVTRAKGGLGWEKGIGWGWRDRERLERSSKRETGGWDLSSFNFKSCGVERAVSEVGEKTEKK